MAARCTHWRCSEALQTPWSVRAHARLTCRFHTFSSLYSSQMNATVNVFLVIIRALSSGAYWSLPSPLSPWSNFNPIVHTSPPSFLPYPFFCLLPSPLPLLPFPSLPSSCVPPPILHSTPFSYPLLLFLPPSAKWGSWVFQWEIVRKGEFLALVRNRKKLSEVGFVMRIQLLTCGNYLLFGNVI